MLNSLSGTPAISEVAVTDAGLMGVDELNKSGGVLGQQIVPVVQDGPSDWPTFAEKTKLLLQKEKVAAVFGCWTSASRKAVVPVVEQLNGATTLLERNAREASARGIGQPWVAP